MLAIKSENKGSNYNNQTIWIQMIGFCCFWTVRILIFYHNNLSIFFGYSLRNRVNALLNIYYFYTMNFEYVMWNQNWFQFQKHCSWNVWKLQIHFHLIILFSYNFKTHQPWYQRVKKNSWYKICMIDHIACE